MSAIEVRDDAVLKGGSEEARRLARELGLEFVDLDNYPVDPSASSMLPETVARSRVALPLGWRDGTAVVAVARPHDVIAMDDLRSVVGGGIRPVVAPAGQIAERLDRLYGSEREPAGATVVPLAPLPGGAEDGPFPVEIEGEVVDQPQGEALSRERSEEEAVSEDERAPVGLLDDLGAGGEEELASFDLGEPGAADELGTGRQVDWTLTLVPPEVEEKTLDLAEMLLASGQVTKDEMEAALREQAATGVRLEEILSGLGLVSDEDLMGAMANELGLEFVDLNSYSLDPQAAALLPEAMARRHQALPIGFRGDTPVVALANPSDVFALDDLRTLLGPEIHTVLSTPRQVAEYITRAYKRDEETEAAAQSALTQQAPDGAHILELSDVHAAVEDAPIVKYVNLILRQALTERASDVHIEPAADDFRIRFRIDGVLHDVTRSPKAIQGGVVTRLKVMANLDIAEHRIPQDGRISITAGQREVDLRLATLPTVHGEKVVMRVLDKSNASLNLAELGFLPAVMSRYEASFHKPYGTILVTGPTGSGKSTTLYATLNSMNSAERNLITVEDPVEYQMPGVNQMQVNPKAGLTFASALRTILRSDPDVILVGEVRDRETAIIAVEAALTGHLVLTTLHTNDAAGTPMRLVEMGVEPFLVGSALDCVVAQRLARQLCENCSECYNPSEEELELVGWADDDAPEGGPPRFRRAVGCQACSRTGYHGRLALHELLLMSEEIERAVNTGSSVEEIARIATEQGMVRLRHDGLRKAALGLTSLEEILRVVA